ncbi:MAG: type II secretion system minor pseudopilin GspI, partial [Burkholderiales bacterium]
MKSRGFTLVELLVALAIVAVALAAGMRALTQAADGATALKSRTLALWVAQNVLARAQLANPTPPTG